MSLPSLLAAPASRDIGLFVQVKPHPQGLMLCSADDPILHQPCSEIIYRHDPNLVTFQHTLMAKCLDIGSQALTAQQVGEPIQLFVMAIRPTRLFPSVDQEIPLVVMNPRITWRSKAQVRSFETCPSTPDIFAKIWRHAKIKVSFMAFTGKQEVREFAGFAARIFQHACDHLEGKPFTEQGLPTEVLTEAEYMEHIQSR